MYVIKMQSYAVLFSVDTFSYLKYIHFFKSVQIQRPKY